MIVHVFGSTVCAPSLCHYWVVFVYIDVTTVSRESGASRMMKTCSWRVSATLPTYTRCSSCCMSECVFRCELGYTGERCEINTLDFYLETNRKILCLSLDVLPTMNYRLAAAVLFLGRFLF